jgi:hypothetical protein
MEVHSPPDGPQGLDGFAADHGEALTRFAFLLTADSDGAEDLVQAVLLKLVERGGLTGIDHPGAHARKMLVNHAFSPPGALARRAEALPEVADPRSRRSRHRTRPCLSSTREAACSTEGRGRPSRLRGSGSRPPDAAASTGGGRCGVGRVGEPFPAPASGPAGRRTYAGAVRVGAAHSGHRAVDRRHDHAAGSVRR